MKEKSPNNVVPASKALERSSDVVATDVAALIIWESRLDRDDDEYYGEVAMSHESLEGWCDGVLSSGSGASECLAELFAALMECLDEGTEVIRMRNGAARVTNTLCEGMELMYRRSEAYRLGLQLYMLSKFGQVKPEDEPVSVLSRAIKRSSAEYAESEQQRAVRNRRASGGKTKGKGPRA